MNRQGPFASFAPWIIFMVVASPSTWEFAAGAALIAALILAAPSEGQSLKMLNVVSIVFFAALTVAGLVLDRSDLDWLEDYAQAISSGALALAVLATLPFVPFTEQYARESAPREVWDTPRFKQVNQVLTVVWGLAFLLSAILGVIAQEDGNNGMLNWVIPIALIVGAFKFSDWYPNRARAAAAAGGAGSGAPAQ